MKHRGVAVACAAIRQVIDRAVDGPQHVIVEKIRNLGGVAFGVRIVECCNPFARD
jgi:hypothetical protein